MRKGRKLKEQKKSNYGSIHFWFFFGFLILILPLVHSTSTLDPVLMPRLLTLSGFLLAFSLFVVFTRHRISANFGFVRLYVFWVAAGFLIVTILTTNGALNVKESLFDISKTTVFVVTLLFAFFSLQQQENWPDGLTRIISIAALIAVSIGIAQYISKVLPYPDPLLPDRRSVVYLVNGVMAHKNLFASSLLLMLPFLVYGCFKFRGAWKWTVVTASVLVVFLIFLLMTRAVWLGLFVGIAFTVLLLIVKGQILGLSSRVRILMAIGSFLILAAGYGVLSKMDTGEDFTPVERIKSIVSPRDAHNQPRIKIWSITLDMGKDYPVAGVGPGNWKLIMADYLEGFGFLKEQINWYRPHNDFLWNLAEKGFFGLLLFLGLFVLTAFYLLYVIFRSEKNDDKTFSLCLFAGLIAYIVVSFFDFPYERINHQVYFAIMIAAAGTKYLEVKRFNPINIKIPAVVPIAFILLIFPFVYGISSTQFEVQVNNVKRVQHFGQWAQMLEISKKIPTTFRDIDPNGLPVLFYSGMAYDQLGDLQNARVSYEEALKAHPKNISVMNNLAVVYHKSGQREIAIDLLNNALKLAPDYHEGIVNLSSFYGIAGDYQKSYDVITRIRHGERTDDINARIKFLEGKLKASNP